MRRWRIRTTSTERVVRPGAGRGLPQYGGRRRPAAEDSSMRRAGSSAVRLRTRWRKWCRSGSDAALQVEDVAGSPRGNQVRRSSGIPIRQPGPTRRIPTVGTPGWRLHSARSGTRCVAASERVGCQDRGRAPAMPRRRARARWRCDQFREAVTRGRGRAGSHGLFTQTGQNSPVAQPEPPPQVFDAFGRCTPPLIAKTRLWFRCSLARSCSPESGVSANTATPQAPPRNPRLRRADQQRVLSLQRHAQRVERRTKQRVYSCRKFEPQRALPGRKSVRSASSCAVVSASSGWSGSHS